MINKITQQLLDTSIHYIEGVADKVLSIRKQCGSDDEGKLHAELHEMLFLLRQRKLEMRGLAKLRELSNLL